MDYNENERIANEINNVANQITTIITYLSLQQNRLIIFIMIWFNPVFFDFKTMKM